MASETQPPNRVNGSDADPEEKTAAPTRKSNLWKRSAWLRRLRTSPLRPAARKRARKPEETLRHSFQHNPARRTRPPLATPAQRTEREVIA